MNSNKIVHKLINCCNNRINQNLDRIFDKNDKIDMNIIDASYTFDRDQLIFNFIADNRVDFRDLAKK